MSNFQTVQLGNTQVRFFSSRLAEKDVQQAAGLVAPSFKNLPKDSFVILGMDGPQMVAAVPAKPKAKLFPVPTQGIGILEAMKQALEQAANFLTNQA